MSAPAVLIMAAGKGTRMRSALPKALHPLCGRPMVCWPVEAARAAGFERIVAILSPGSEVAAALPEGVEVAVQQDARGTGDAVATARDAVGSAETLIVLSGDTPLLTAEFLNALADHHAEQAAAMTMVTMRLADPSGYGRVVRLPDGSVERVAETKTAGDATAAELAIDEVNAGIYAFRSSDLFAALSQISPHNSQGEHYLPDVLPFLRAQGRSVVAFELADPEVTLGVNSRVELAAAEAVLNRRLIEQHQLAGVTVTDPRSTWIEADVTIGEDTTILPGCLLRAGTEIAGGCTIGPHSTLVSTTVGAGSQVIQSYCSAARIGERVNVGPFAYLRPDADLAAGSKAGAFVEIKNSSIGEGAKVPHLSYIGDADVGAGSNIGAGNITANYDGKDKHRTTIGEQVRTGVDTAFVAPVTVGDGAYTGAGSVITEDVPPGALGIARQRQQNIEGFAKRNGNDGDDRG